MNETLEVNLQAYDFELPLENIAQFPADRRDNSRLLFIDQKKQPSDHLFNQLPELLQAGDLIIRNDTKVIPARLLGRRSGGGKTEALLMHPATRSGEDGYQEDADRVCWVCLAKPCNHLKAGKIVTFGEGSIEGRVEKMLGGGRVIFSFNISQTDFMQTIDRIGELPLPPYIDRTADGVTRADKERYQTTFARESGAVAAPTAGLHFTPEVDTALHERGIKIATLTLHVGPGTFRPIIAEDIREHRMDGEYYEVPQATADLINQTKRNGGRLIAVGTTSTRTLETVTDDAGITHAGSGWADLFIRPGYRFKAIDGLITNFHLPKSSLLVLVSALMGRERMLEVYKGAVERGYRFYSYGDAMLLIP